MVDLGKEIVTILAYTWMVYHVGIPKLLARLEIFIKSWKKTIEITSIIAMKKTLTAPNPYMGTLTRNQVGFLSL